MSDQFGSCEGPNVLRPSAQIRLDPPSLLQHDAARTSPLGRPEDVRFVVRRVRVHNTRVPARIHTLLSLFTTAVNNARRKRTRRRARKLYYRVYRVAAAALFIV